MMRETEKKYADEALAEMTGKPREEFSAEGYRIPDPDELERVPVDDTDN